MLVYVCKQYKILCFLICIVMLLTACRGDGGYEYKINRTETFSMTDKSVINPYMGFAPWAEDTESVSICSLVYIDVTFRELQPESCSEFDFESIEKEKNIKAWKDAGKHAVLRFVCDYPSEESHSDIPDWLMEITRGNYYDISYGKGYCPDYSDKTFIEYHRKAIEALAGYFDDGFTAFVELGSIGHWGEWHIKDVEGMPPMPSESVRNEYINHYVDAFSGAKLLMRRPFKGADVYNTGVYNDVFGKTDATNEWLAWIENGGEYKQGEESVRLTSMPDFWKTSPSGGEISGAFSTMDIYTKCLDDTVLSLQEAHTTFLGPNSPADDDGTEENIRAMVSNRLIAAMGYRLGIVKAEMKQKYNADTVDIILTWKNDGVAPIYFDLPVYLYVQQESGGMQTLGEVDIKLSEIMPGETYICKTVVSEKDISPDVSMYIGVADYDSDKPVLALLSDQAVRDDFYFLIFQ
ncbi:MAG: DUF4832 domain-containing protein [Clostridia bacterium]|nr:DUF4832 domain-containing protein [Clostridia bacterium]